MSSVSIDDKIQKARSIVAEAEARDGQTWAIVRGLLGEIEENLRALRIEKARRDMQYYTRKQFAERLQVSESTVARAERRGEIQPAVAIGILGRYSSLQLEFAGEIFSKKRGPDGRPREQKASREANAPRN